MSKYFWLPSAAAIAIVAILAFTGPSAQAQANYTANFPSHPMRMIIPFAAGGPTDIVGRIMGAKMSEILGRQIVVEDRAGAGGNIGADYVAKSAPDGYTMLMATVSTNAINPGLYRHMPYDAIRDFAPLGRVGVTPTLLMANLSLPVTDVKSLVTLIKANPGKYSFGSSGVGSILHLCGEEFKADAGGLDLVHVPYKGSAPMDTDLLGGQIAVAFDATPTAMPLALAGKVRALGAGMAKRIPAMPNLPTLQEQGIKGFECYTWNAILAPAGTPKPIVDKLNAAINTSLADPKVSSA
ncbi:MAG: Bug family tripartite tricarboxylate transporter substrate binding protein, partial [Xanthobacteraceae bacterium]